MQDNHSGYLLYHVERAHGARQDLILEASLPIYMNRSVNVKYLDYCLKMPGKKRENILMRNLFTLLASPEMVSQSCCLLILFFSIGIPTRWLSGMTHEVKDYPVGAPPEKQWCTRSMGRVIDTLYKTVNILIKTPTLFLSKRFMMDIFVEYRRELPPFQEYWTATFEKNNSLSSLIKQG